MARKDDIEQAVEAARSAGLDGLADRMASLPEVPEPRRVDLRQIAGQRVLVGREVAIKVAGMLPPADDRELLLDCSEVDVASPPFWSELMRLRPDVVPDRLNIDVAGAWLVASERARKRAGS